MAAEIMVFQVEVSTHDAHTLLLGACAYMGQDVVMEDVGNNITAVYLSAAGMRKLRGLPEDTEGVVVRDPNTGDLFLCVGDAGHPVNVL